MSSVATLPGVAKCIVGHTWILRVKLRFLAPEILCSPMVIPYQDQWGRINCEFGTNLTTASEAKFCFLMGGGVLSINHTSWKEVFGLYWKTTKIKSVFYTSSWWLNQPIWKISSSNWILSPSFGVKIKNLCVATTSCWVGSHVLMKFVIPVDFFTRGRKSEKRSKSTSQSRSFHCEDDTWKKCPKSHMLVYLYEISRFEYMKHLTSGTLVLHFWWIHSVLLLQFERKETFRPRDVVSATAVSSTASFVSFGSFDSFSGLVSVFELVSWQSKGTPQHPTPLKR